MQYISKRRLYRKGPLHAPLLFRDGIFVRKRSSFPLQVLLDSNINRVSPRNTLY